MADASAHTSCHGSGPLWRRLRCFRDVGHLATLPSALSGKTHVSRSFHRLPHPRLGGPPPPCPALARVLAPWSASTGADPGALAFARRASPARSCAAHRDRRVGACGIPSRRDPAPVRPDGLRCGDARAHLRCRFYIEPASRNPGATSRQRLSTASPGDRGDGRPRRLTRFQGLRGIGADCGPIPRADRHSAALACPSAGLVAGTAPASSFFPIALRRAV